MASEGLAPLGRRLLAEFVGTGLLVTVVVGSGIAAERLSPGDVGLQLLYNSTATVFGLSTLILMLGPVSGAHFNPVVSGADWLLGRRVGTGLPGRDFVGYTLVQTAGAVGGALLANLMFDLPTRLSDKDRSDWHLWIGEVVATAGLVALIFALARTGRGRGPRRLSARTSGRLTGSRPRRRSRTRVSAWAGCSPIRSRASTRRRCPAS
jgi:glycerol uptake facilitator-like aquaporin